MSLRKNASMVRKSAPSVGWIRKASSGGWEIQRLSRFAFVERRKHSHKYRMVKDGQLLQYFDGKEEIQRALEELCISKDDDSSFHGEELLRRLRACGAALDNSDEESESHHVRGHSGTSNSVTRSKALDSSLNGEADSHSPSHRTAASFRGSPTNSAHNHSQNAAHSPLHESVHSQRLATSQHGRNAHESPRHDIIDAEPEKPSRRTISMRQPSRPHEDKPSSRTHGPHSHANDLTHEASSDSQSSPNSPAKPLVPSLHLGRLSSSSAPDEKRISDSHSPRKTQSPPEASPTRGASSATLLRKGSARSGLSQRSELSPRSHNTLSRGQTMTNSSSSGVHSTPADDRKTGPPPRPGSMSARVASSRTLHSRSQPSSQDTSPAPPTRRNSSLNPSIRKTGSIRKSGTYSSPDSSAQGNGPELLHRTSMQGARKSSMRNPVQQSTSSLSADGNLDSPSTSFRSSSRESRPSHGSSHKPAVSPARPPHASDDKLDSTLVKSITQTDQHASKSSHRHIDKPGIKLDKDGSLSETSIREDTSPPTKREASPMISPRMEPTPDPDTRRAKSPNSANGSTSAGFLAVPDAAIGTRDKKPRTVPDKGPILTEAQKPVTEKEKVIAWYYDDPSNTWTYKDLEVRLAQEYFAQGGMRKAFHMLICDPDGRERPFVAKLYNEYAEKEIIAPDDSMFGTEDSERMVGKHWALRTLKRQTGCEFEAMLMQICCPDGSMFSLREFLTWHRRLKLFKIDVEMQGFCQTYAAEFNKRNPPKPVVFLDAFLIVCVNRPQQPTFACEPLIKGDFIKHNNNCGLVQSQRSMERNTPQAFSHFTYWYSRNQYIIVDIQGVNDTYTDPQVHSVDRSGFGMGNLGQEGIDCFFKTHKCNNICMGLGLVHPLKENRPESAN